MADTTYKKEHAAAQHGVLGTIAAGGEDNVADHKQSSHGVHSELLAGGKEAIDDHKRAVHGTLSTIAAGGESAVLDHKQAANAVLGDVAAGGAEHRANHEAALKAIHDALPKRPARPDGLELVGAGPGGISEMQALVKNDEMYFGLLVFTVGSGTFMRHKLVNVHFQGEGMSAIKRGRILARRKVATDILKNTHAAVQFVQQSDVTLDFVISHLGKFFAADHGDHDIDVGKIKDDYEAMIAATKVAQLSLNKQSTRKTARDFKAKPSGKQVLEWVHAESAKDGPFNWALFEPNKKKLEFFNAGSLSVDEMLNDLDPKKVLAGILRMSFGTGRFKRTKWIAIWWSGEEVSAVQRGKLNAMKGAMTKMLAPYTLIHTAQTADDISLEILIKKVHDYCTIDGKGEHGEDLYTVEAFMDALEDELGDNADFFGDNGAAGPKEESIEEVVKKVRKFQGYNWVLLKLNDPKKKKKKRGKKSKK